VPIEEQQVAVGEADELRVADLVFLLSVIASGWPSCSEPGEVPRA